MNKSRMIKNRLSLFLENKPIYLPIYVPELYSLSIINTKTNFKIRNKRTNSYQSSQSKPLSILLIRFALSLYITNSMHH